MQILQVSARIVIRRLENERRVRKFRMLRKAAQGFATDVSFAGIEDELVPDVTDVCVTDEASRELSE